MMAWDSDAGARTRDPAVTVVPLAQVLAASEALLDGTSPVTQARVRLLRQAQELLAS